MDAIRATLAPKTKNSSRCAIPASCQFQQWPSLHLPIFNSGHLFICLSPSVSRTIPVVSRPNSTLNIFLVLMLWIYVQQLSCSKSLASPVWICRLFLHVVLCSACGSSPFWLVSFFVVSLLNSFVSLPFVSCKLRGDVSGHT